MPTRLQDAIRISIHALREEGDTRAAATGSTEPISIHALREEGDLTESFSQKATQRFLSTPSARRATSRPKRCNSSRRISIHALREEGDGLTDRG